jgi:hypothetical protein
MAIGSFPTVTNSVDFCILAVAVAAEVLRLTRRMTKVCDPSAGWMSLDSFSKRYVECRTFTLFLGRLFACNEYVIPDVLMSRKKHDGIAHIDGAQQEAIDKVPSSQGAIY